jgi:hypothetical protein
MVARVAPEDARDPLVADATLHRIEIGLDRLGDGTRAPAVTMHDRSVRVKRRFAPRAGLEPACSSRRFA